MSVVITGVGPGSIGATTALSIASQSPKAVILASRTPSKLDAVAAEISEKYPGVTTHKVPLDLASLDSVKAAAAQIDSLVDHVDVLINNAAVNSLTREPVTTPGDTVVDLQFFVNHLSPFLFTNLLLPKLRAAAANSSKGATRVVNLTSMGHHLSPVRFYDYQFAHYVYDGVPEDQKPPKGLPEGFLRAVDGYPCFISYGQSKTANILHATELTRRLRKSGEEGILGFSVHPGTIRTELSRNLDEDGRQAIDSVTPPEKWKSLDQGSATTVVAAFDPKLAEQDIGGQAFGYMADCQLTDHLLSEHAKDPQMAHRLYEESERLLSIKTGLAPVLAA